MEPAFYEKYLALDRTHWWFRGRRATVLLALERALGDRRVELLDFGTGTGGNLEHLARFGRVQAVDGDEHAVRFCRSRSKDVQLVPDGQPLPFADASFDVVTALDVIEHIADDRRALAELRRVLRPGGLLLVTVPAFQFLWGDQDEISRHQRRYSARALSDRLAGSGFELEHLSYFNTLLFPPIAAIRVLRRLLRSPSAARTDFDIGRPWLNGILGRLFAAEAPIVTRFRVPFGVSLLALARSPAP